MMLIARHCHCHYHCHCLCLCLCHYQCRLRFVCFFGKTFIGLQPQRARFANWFISAKAKCWLLWPTQCAFRLDDQMIYFWSIFVSLIHSFIYLFYILLLSERLHINIFRNAILTSRNCCVCAIYAYAYRCILHVYIWLVKYLFDRFQHHCHAPSPLRVCQQHYTHSTRHSTVQHSTAKGLLFNY